MKTILLIEDNTEIRENMEEILELAGYRVLTAPDGKQGVELALARIPDVIVCDIMMPELDGYGVIHLLQKNPATQAIPFIFLTAKAERAELRKGMELGADDYITKPFSGTELLQAIEGRLKKAEASKAVVAAGLQELQSLVRQTGNRSLEEVFGNDQETRSYQKNEAVYKEGNRPHRLFRVGSGRVKIFRTNDDGKELIILICQPGDFFGYTALLEDVSYQESAVALEPAEIDSISRDAFEKLLQESPETIRQFIKVLAGRVHEREEQLIAIAYSSLRKKVANALIQLHGASGQSADAPAGIRISRENLAAIAGAATESLIRTLSDFRSEGLIEIRGKEIIVLQEERLRKLMN